MDFFHFFLNFWDGRNLFFSWGFFIPSNFIFPPKSKMECKFKKNFRVFWTFVHLVHLLCVCSWAATRAGTTLSTCHCGRASTTTATLTRSSSPPWTRWWISSSRPPLCSSAVQIRWPATGLAPSPSPSRATGNASSTWSAFTCPYWCLAAAAIRFGMWRDAGPTRRPFWWTWTYRTICRSTSTLRRFGLISCSSRSCKWTKIKTHVR